MEYVYLTNGQILTGKIKAAGLGLLKIDDIDLNNIDVKMVKVRTIRAAQIFKIETVSREVFYSSLRPSDENGYVILDVPDTLTCLRIIDISSIIPLERKFIKGLDGNLNAGLSYSKSTSIGQVNLSSQLSYKTKSFQNQLNISMIGSIDSSGYSRDNEGVELFSGYAISTNWFFAGLLAYQKNTELAISFRFQEMTGIGNKMIIRNNLQLLAISGLTFNQEKSTTGDYKGFLLELPVMLRFDFFNFKSPNMQISTTPTAYFGLTQFGRIRFNANVNVSYKLIKDLSLSLNLFNNYDNEPPSETTNKVDYGIVFGITNKF